MTKQYSFAKKSTKYVTCSSFMHSVLENCVCVLCRRFRPTFPNSRRIIIYYRKQTKKYFNKTLVMLSGAYQNTNTISKVNMDDIGKLA